MIPGWSRFAFWALSVPVRVKIVGIILGVVVLLGVGVTLQVRSIMRATLELELEQRAAAVARDVAGRATDLVVTNNLIALRELTRATLRHSEDTRYVLVLDSSGMILSHTLPGTPSPALLRANRPAENGRVAVQVLRTEEGRIFDAAVSIFEGRAGSARVGMSDRQVRMTVAATTRRLLGVTALVSLGSVAAGLLLTFILTRPVLELGKVAEAVGRGDFSQKAAVWSHDEVGRLSEAFNAMTGALDRSRRELLRRNAELSALNAIAVTVSRSLDLNEILGGALRQALADMKLPAGWITLENEGEGVLAAAVGLPPAAVRHWTADASVPLKAKERVLGTMNVVTDADHPLGEDDLGLLRSIGHEIGLAVENARLYEEVQHKEEIRRELLEQLITAQEEERRRLARELHDEVGQSLTALIMNVDSAEAAVPPELEAIRRQLRDIRDLLSATLEEIRRLMVDLRPTLLDDLGLIPAIQWFAETHLARAGIQAAVEVVGPRRRLPAHVETAIFRVLQEAITNIVRHSGARRADVRMRFGEGMVAAEIADEGKGFDLRAARGQLGLRGMKERVTLLGGRWKIDSSPGIGTRIAFEIPLGVAG